MWRDQQSVRLETVVSVSVFIKIALVSAFSLFYNRNTQSNASALCIRLSEWKTRERKSTRLCVCLSDQTMCVTKLMVLAARRQTKRNKTNSRVGEHEQNKTQTFNALGITWFTHMNTNRWCTRTNTSPKCSGFILCMWCSWNFQYNKRKRKLLLISNWILWNFRIFLQIFLQCKQIRLLNPKNVAFRLRFSLARFKPFESVENRNYSGFKNMSIYFWIRIFWLRFTQPRQ